MGTVAELAKTELRNIAANQELVHKLDKIKDIAEEYKSYNRTGFEEILKIIESEDNNEQS